MDPVSLLLAGSVGVQIFGGIMGSSAERRQGQRAKELSDYEAQLIEQDSSLDVYLNERQGAEDVTNLLILGRRQYGTAKALYGGSGVTLEGSPMDVLKENLSAIEKDAETIKFNTMMKSYVTSTRAKQQADLTRRRGQAALEGANYGAAATLLNTGSNILSSITSRRS